MTGDILLGALESLGVIERVPTTDFTMAWAVEHKAYVYKVLFNCKRCGNCCRYVPLGDLHILKVKLGTTICEHFTEPNICAIYGERPECCWKFPVYSGNWSYCLKTCPEFKKFDNFKAHRAWRLACRPWGHYEMPDGKDLIQVTFKGEKQEKVVIVRHKPTGLTAGV